MHRAFNDFNVHRAFNDFIFASQDTFTNFVLIFCSGPILYLQKEILDILLQLPTEKFFTQVKTTFLRISFL